MENYHLQKWWVQKNSRKNPLYLEFSLRLPSGDLVGFENDEDDVVVNPKAKIQWKYELFPVLFCNSSDERGNHLKWGSLWSFSIL